VEANPSVREYEGTSSPSCVRGVLVRAGTRVARTRDVPGSTCVRARTLRAGPELSRPPNRRTSPTRGTRTGRTAGLSFVARIAARTVPLSGYVDRGDRRSVVIDGTMRDPSVRDEATATATATAKQNQRPIIPKDQIDKDRIQATATATATGNRNRNRRTGATRPRTALPPGWTGAVEDVEERRWEAVRPNRFFGVKDR
jgi:hypothetical protein